MKTESKKRPRLSIMFFSCVIIIGIGLKMGQKVNTPVLIAISNLNKATVSSIRLQALLSELGLKRNNFNWQMTHPQQGVVNFEIIIQILNLLSLQSDIYYTADSLNLIEYGLTPRR